MYASFGRRISECNSANDFSPILAEMSDKFSERWPSAKEAEIGFQQLVFTNTITKNKSIIRYILHKVYDHIFGGLPLDVSQTTIEHLLPQSSSVDDEIKGQIGNLVLVSSTLNQELGTKDFKDKLNILNKSDFPVEDIIKSSSKWGENEIKKRTAMLSQMAYEDIWTI